MDFPKYAEHQKDQIRSFTYVMGAFFTILCVISAYKNDWSLTLFAKASLGIAVAWVAAGLIAPMPLKPLYHGWMILSFCMNFVMTRVILSILFYLIFLPIALLLRLVGKDILDMRSKRDSYWLSYRKQAPKEHFDHLYTMSEVADGSDKPSDMSTHRA